MDTTSEIWKPVVGWEDFYEVSDQGRVRSLDRMTPGRSGILVQRRGKVLKHKIGLAGHHSVQLCDGKKRWPGVHVLVLEAFIGPRPTGMMGCHNNGDPSDNRLDNLRWDTPAANAADAVKHGTMPNRSGTRHEIQYDYPRIDGEVWRAVIGRESTHEVSTHGRVRAVGRMTTGRGGSRFWRRGHLMTPSVTKSGHQYARFTGKSTPVHSLVLEAFIGARPEGMLGCHNNGDPTDNRLVNLRWDTPSSNAHDTVKHGTHPMSGKTHCKNGHEYTAENTDTSRGYRRCRQCGRNEVLKRRPLSPKGAFKDRTHCPQGHEYTSENTIVFESATKRSRSCRTCSNARARAKRAPNLVQVTARTCETCAGTFMAKYSNARNCSHACRATARRRRLKAASN